MALTRTARIFTVTEGQSNTPDPLKPNETIVDKAIVVIATDAASPMLPQQNIQFEVPIADAGMYVVGSKVTLSVA